MTPKPRNIIIFLGIAAALSAVYIFFVRPDAREEQTLVTTPNSSLPDLGAAGTNTASNGGTMLEAGNFLSLLLNVRNIRLEDAVFSDPDFKNLRDSSIVLVPDTTAGRPNPFAKLGADPLMSPPISATPPPLPEDSEDDPVL